MRLLTLAAASLVFAAPHVAIAQQNSVAADPCARYKWDITRERALFAATASPIAAAKEGGPSLSTIATDQAYRVQLFPAAEVVFATAPGKASPAEGSYAGMLAFKVPVAGSYRVAVDLPMWLDVVADSRLVPAADYEGQHDCAAPRKIVQFSLEANKALILQMSGVSEASVRVTIVRASAN
jgi:hypothetical protein